MSAEAVTSQIYIQDDRITKSETQESLYNDVYSKKPSTAGSEAPKELDEGALADITLVDATIANFPTNNALSKPGTSEKSFPEVVLLPDVHEVFYREELERKKAAIKASLTDRSKVSPTYYTNGKKEMLVLEYVDNFNRQYAQLYPGRKELMLCPPNELGIKVRPQIWMNHDHVCELKFFRNLSVQQFVLPSYLIKSSTTTGAARNSLPNTSAMSH